MSKQKYLIVANWKMNPGGIAEARVLFNRTKLTGEKLERVETVICPPFPYLALFHGKAGKRVSLGAQDAFYANAGRATGEVSPEMLADIGVAYVILGHSERRALGERDESIAKKVKAVLAERMSPILCIGEKERDSDGAYFSVLKEELLASLSGVSRAQFRDLVIAYEPLWTIGKSAREAMGPVMIHETVIFIRKVLADAFGEEAAQIPRILYGGAVEGENAKAILMDGNVAGLLIGHASLDAEGFAKLLKTVQAQ